MTGTIAEADSVLALPTRWREFFVTAPQLSLATTYRLANGACVLSINVHCLVFERWGTMRFRSQLAGLKQAMKVHNGPIIFAGDFNTWNQERLALLTSMTEELGLEEVKGFPNGRTTAGTTCKFVNWLTGCDSRLPLDRVFYRGFRLESAAVLNYTSSDHVPLKVTLALVDSA
jgi:endonuclease/exonuclease/phosphatase (EEP) superfamily protein YafD